MRELPIEAPGFGVERTRLQRTVADPAYGNHFRIVSTGEDLVRLLKVLVGKNLLDYGHAASAQQPNHPLAGDAREKCSIGDRRKYHAVLGHKNVGRSQL